MLSAEENEVLTQVGPGTPMGSLLRRYWLPALLSEEVPEPDGAPVEVRLLGEDLVAFRDSDGAVGLLQQRCPHRGASLSYGRNEDGGLRCIYHGWKFDVAGRCMDLPTEPEGSPFQDKLRATSYATKEVAGIVWTYMGPAEDQPEIPDFEWMSLPPENRKIWKISQACNYFQMVERDIDSAHISVLHRRAGDDDEIRGTLGDGALEESSVADLDRRDTAPAIEVQPTAYGFRYAALRKAPDGTQVARIYPFVYPWHPFIPAFPSGYRVTHAFVAQDDTTSWHYLICYHPDQPVDVEHYERTRGLRLDGFDKIDDLDNRHGQDRAAMRRGSFSGIDGVIMEDHAIVEIQGPVVDRTAENLGSTDEAIRVFRGQLLGALASLSAGGSPPGLEVEYSYRDITGDNIVLQPGEDWRDAAPLPDRYRVDGSASGS